MKKLFGIVFFIMITIPAFAENYLLNGEQESEIHYQMSQKIIPSLGIRQLMLSYVIPKTFDSPTYYQKITKLNVIFSSPPLKREEKTDLRGNKIIENIWESPATPITATISFIALNRVKLQPLKTEALFPLSNLPKDIKAYLEPTRQVPVNDRQIQAKARELTKSAKTEFDAVQKILTWVIDQMHYVLIPETYNAIYSFRTGKGNCQNYSHLAAALMRAVGIPVRIVNGITLNQPYEIRIENNVRRLKMALGRHSWIEVWFPDLGWVPYDPQDSQLFVSNRFIRVEVGLDNNETKNDGLIRWTQAKNRSEKPRFKEEIFADFRIDQVNIIGKKMNYGPTRMLLSPRVEANFSKISVTPPLPLPEKIPEKKLMQLKYSIPYRFGNLEFPENVDFLSSRGPAQEVTNGTMEMRKNFLVETAEYVTTRGEQYAQTFILNKPMLLKKVGLALHKFSNEGQLWLELFHDDNGKPGKYISTSKHLRVSQMKYIAGYTWVDFEFNKDMVILSPGRYWVALGFTDGPIINWFFTYGKPVGPQDGTRYRKVFEDTTWSRSLSYEFNYRVMGLVPEN